MVLIMGACSGTSTATTNSTGCIHRSAALIPPFPLLRELLHVNIDTMKACGLWWRGWRCLQWAAPPSKSGPMTWGGGAGAVFIYLLGDQLDYRLEPKHFWGPKWWCLELEPEWLRLSDVSIKHGYFIFKVVIWEINLWMFLYDCILQPEEKPLTKQVSSKIDIKAEIRFSVALIPNVGNS